MMFARVRSKLSRSPLRVGTFWICVLAAVDAIAFASVAGQGLQQTASSRPSPEVVSAPDSAQPRKVDDQQAKQNTPTVGDDRRKQISEDSANLLKLATELKAEVDKTSKDTLSLNVIRKASAIEKLAHDVKEKMKTSVGAN